MARHFTRASSEKIVMGLGGCGFVMGPGTAAAIIRVSSLPGTMVIFTAGATLTTPSWQFQIQGGGVNSPAISTNGSLGQGPSTAITTGKWYLVAASKISGTAAPRGHIYDYAADTWVHQNAGTSLADSGTPLTRTQIGCTGGNSAFFDGDIAALGVWNIVLSDAQVEALPYGLAAWFAPAQPKGLWLLDQDTVAQLLSDFTGGGADQSSITGTSIVAASVPIFNRGAPLSVF